jgi:Beta-propeller repeat.
MPPATRTSRALPHRATFPLVNALDRSLGKKGDVDVFITKMNSAGTGVVWSTYLGGSASSDRAVGVAVDAAGSVYITGTTSGADFPTTSNAWQPASASGGFVAKLVPAGNALAYSTYVANANPSAIAVDATGSAYVTGSATSGFVTTPGALRTVTGNPAGSTGFVLKLNANGTAPIFATFLGGAGDDDATSVAVDVHGNAFVAGWTTSADFPVRNAFQATRSAGKDAFVAKLASDGAQLLYSTLLGGALDDAVNGIAVDVAGNAYVVGETYSWDFPVKSGFQMQKAGQRLVNSSVGNAFVAKLAPAGNALVYASFLGGEVCQTLCQLVFGPAPQYRADAGYGIAVDAAGHAYVTGIARSYTFPLVDSSAVRKQEDNQDSAFVAKVAVSGGTLLWSTFLRTGFGESDSKVTRLPPGAASAVAIDAAGAAYVTGDADAASNFQPTPGAFQGTSTIGPAAIVVKFAPAPAMSLATSAASTDTQTPVTLDGRAVRSAGVGKRRLHERVNADRHRLADRQQRESYADAARGDLHAERGSAHCGLGVRLGACSAARRRFPRLQLKTRSREPPNASSTLRADLLLHRLGDAAGGPCRRMDCRARPPGATRT